VTDRLVSRITADETGGKIACLLQLGQIAVARRPGEPPVQVQFVVRLAAAIGPATAALHHDRGEAEYSFEACARLLWV
jgi:hypothetical protein